jgi:hypothetical protein
MNDDGWAKTKNLAKVHWSRRPSLMILMGRVTGITVHQTDHQKGELLQA